MRRTGTEERRRRGTPNLSRRAPSSSFRQSSSSSVILSSGSYGFVTLTVGTLTSVFFVPTTGFCMMIVSGLVPTTGVLIVSVLVPTSTLGVVTVCVSVPIGRRLDLVLIVARLLARCERQREYDGAE